MLYAIRERSEEFLYDLCFVYSLVTLQPIIIIDTDVTDWTDYH